MNLLKDVDAWSSLGCVHGTVGDLGGIQLEIEGETTKTNNCYYYWTYTSMYSSKAGTIKGDVYNPLKSCDEIIWQSIMQIQ